MMTSLSSCADVIVKVGLTLFGMLFLVVLVAILALDDGEADEKRNGN
jgi:Tfp pilus assembly protein FimT